MDGLEFGNKMHVKGQILALLEVQIMIQEKINELEKSNETSN